jgi:membrane associated rhomboid family serine protease
MLPGPHPGLDLPGRVLLVSADRGELRAVQRLSERGGVAFFAHVGGFVFGLLTARLLARAGQAAPRKQWPSTA